MSTTPTFAHYPGEPEEMTEAHLAALEREVEFCEVTAAADNTTDDLKATRLRRTKEAAAEIHRIRGATKTNRLRGGGTTRDDAGEE